MKVSQSWESRTVKKNPALFFANNSIINLICLFLHIQLEVRGEKSFHQSPNLRTPNPGFVPVFNPLFYITHAGGEPRVLASWDVMFIQCNWRNVESGGIGLWVGVGGGGIQTAVGTSNPDTAQTYTLSHIWQRLVSPLSHIMPPWRAAGAMR
jgi:hypothetical protein